MGLKVSLGSLVVITLFVVLCQYILVANMATLRSDISYMMSSKLSLRGESTQSDFDRFVAENTILKGNPAKPAAPTIEFLGSNGDHSRDQVQMQKAKALEVQRVQEQHELVNFNPIQASDKWDRELIASPDTIIEKECDAQYGYSLILNWREAKEVWCEDDAGESSQQSASPSSLVCYPYHQLHKIRKERGKDMFCVAENVFVDFSKVGGDYTEQNYYKPAGEDAYHSFSPGSMFSACAKTDLYDENLFMPHQKLQMENGGFRPMTIPPAGVRYETVDHPVYLLTRDEDNENTFHSVADFMNIFLVTEILQMDPAEMQLLVFDKFAQGQYWDFLKKLFSPSRPMMRRSSYGNSVVKFKKLIFHLESPAALVAPEVSEPGPLRCRSTEVFMAYRRFVLSAYDLYDVLPPPIPSVVLSIRTRTSAKNIGRIMQNQEQVIHILESGNMMNLQIVDFATISVEQQLRILRYTNVLIGVHGAGLMNIMFTADEAVLIEIHPSYRLDRHFRHAARMTGKIYMPIRSQTRETCHDTSDNVVVPLEEFRSTVDGAVRIARSFDDGLSECGLVCPPSILAMDLRLANNYKNPSERGEPLNTDFPCY